MSMFEGLRNCGDLAQSVTSRSSGSANRLGGMNGSGGSMPGGGPAGGDAAGVAPFGVWAWAVARAAIVRAATRTRRWKGRGWEIIAAKKDRVNARGNDGFGGKRSLDQDHRRLCSTRPAAPRQGSHAARNGQPVLLRRRRKECAA